MKAAPQANGSPRGTPFSSSKRPGASVTSAAKGSPARLPPEGFEIEYGVVESAAALRGLGRAFLHPSDMLRHSLLPDDRIVVLLSGIPIWCGAVWSSKRVAVGVARLPIPFTSAIAAAPPGPVRVCAATLDCKADAAAATDDATAQRAASSPLPGSPLPTSTAAAPPRAILVKESEFFASTTARQQSFGHRPVKLRLFREHWLPWPGGEASSGVLDDIQHSICGSFLPRECSLRLGKRAVYLAVEEGDPPQAAVGASAPLVLLSHGGYSLHPGFSRRVAAASSASWRIVALGGGHHGGQAVASASSAEATLAPPISSDRARASSVEAGSVATPFIGGLEEQLRDLTRLASAALFPAAADPSSSSFYAPLRRIRPPRGALLVGPPGTGKTLLARALADALNVPLHVINGPEVLSSVVGASEAELVRKFAACVAAAPAIMFIDEIDGLCPRRDASGEVEARIVATMLSLMEGEDASADDDNEFGRGDGSGEDAGAAHSSNSGIEGAGDAVLGSKEPATPAPSSGSTYRTGGDGAADRLAVSPAAASPNEEDDVAINNLSGAMASLATPSAPRGGVRRDGLPVFAAAAIASTAAADAGAAAPRHIPFSGGAADVAAPSSGRCEVLQASSILDGSWARIGHGGGMQDSWGGPSPCPPVPPSTPCVFILGATNRVSSIDPSLRRPGRFDREIEVGIPGAAARVSILAACLRRHPHTLDEPAMRGIAARLHGYVGADIASLCREAAAAALKRVVTAAAAATAASAGAPTLGEPPSTPAQVTAATLEIESIMAITPADMEVGLRRVQPSALREIAVEVPSVFWDDIGGQLEVKQLLKEAVEWPLTHPQAFVAMGIRPPKGVLLYGPPGCSKTMMAKAMATEGRMNFIAVKGPELFSKYVGDSEKAVAETFHRARAASPCIVFFDEFDALAASRSGADGDGGGSSVITRVVSQLLTELDGIVPLQQVVVVAATNRPDLIDAALLRPGRIDRMLYVGLPDGPARLRIVQLQLARVPHRGIDAEALAEALLEGYSGAEIVGVFRDAAVRAVGANTADPVLLSEHLQAAVGAMPRQVTADMLGFYARFAARGRGPPDPSGPVLEEPGAPGTGPKKGQRKKMPKRL